MKSALEQSAKDPFWFRECFVMTMPIGIKVGNLGELLHVIKEVDEAVLYYHLFQCRLAVSPPAGWLAGAALGGRRLSGD